jgi:hypothetical protein
VPTTLGVADVVPIVNETDVGEEGGGDALPLLALATWAAWTRTSDTALAGG